MESREDFYKNIIERRETLKDKESNCFGTALYLVGEFDSDEFYSLPNNFHWGRKWADEPELGYIAAWLDENDEPYHLAVVTQKNPLRLTTRNGEDGRVFNQSYWMTDFIYSNSFLWKNSEKVRRVFYVPSKLQKILDGEELEREF